MCRTRAGPCPPRTMRTRSRPCTDGQSCSCNCSTAFVLTGCVNVATKTNFPTANERYLKGGGVSPLSPSPPPLGVRSPRNVSCRTPFAIPPPFCVTPTPTLPLDDASISKLSLQRRLSPVHRRRPCAQGRCPRSQGRPRRVYRGYPGVHSRSPRAQRRHPRVHRRSPKGLSLRGSSFRRIHGKRATWTLKNEAHNLLAIYATD